MKLFEKSTLSLFFIVTALFACEDNDSVPKENPNPNPNPIEEESTTIVASNVSTSIDEYRVEGESIVVVEAESSNASAIQFEIANQSPENAVQIDKDSGQITVLDASAFQYRINPTIDGEIKLIAGEESKNIEFEIEVLDIKNLVTTIAGTTTPGLVDGMGTDARFNTPAAICIDKDDTIYIADFLNHAIRKMTPDGTVTTLAGTGVQGRANGPGDSASFATPQGIAVDLNGNIFVSDASNHLIRKITPSGVVSTLAGNGRAGFSDGNGINASFNVPEGIITDSEGNVFVADRENHRIRKITPNGDVTTYAGEESGFVDGNREVARLSKPFALEIDDEDNLYVVGIGRNPGDGFGNYRIRKISKDGSVSTIEVKNEMGQDIHILTMDLTITNDGTLYFADLSVREGNFYKVTPQGEFVIVAGNNGAELIDGIGTAASFSGVRGTDVDSEGNIYGVDFLNHVVRKIVLD